MSDRQDGANQSLEVLYELHKDCGALSFSDFLDVSNSLLGGYFGLLDKGQAPPRIGLAMLGTTVNLYRMFDMEVDLVQLLRTVANDLDCKSSLH